MTARTVEQQVRPVGVGVGGWSVEGAAAPTLVVTSDRRLTDPLPVLETAVAALDRPVAKVALAHPAEDPGVAAEYVFAQVVERGGQRILDLTPECGHSMLATATHLVAHGLVSPADARVRLLTYRSGKRRIVTCEVFRHPDSGAGSHEQYEAGLSFPLEDAGDVFPLGADWFTVSAAGREVLVTVVDSGNPYAFVDARSAGLADGPALFGAGPQAAALLAEVRRQVAPCLSLAQSAVLPKPALILRPSVDEVYVRALSADDWHPGLALTGQVAVAALIAGTVAGEVDLRIGHCGGVAEVGLRTEPDGSRALHVTRRRVVRLTPPSEGA